MENKIDVSVAEETKTQAFDAINSLKTTLPFLLKLSDSDKSTLSMMNDGRKPFVEKSLDYATHNGNVSPGLDMVVAATKDLELFTFLSSLENQLEQLIEMVRDTKQTAGSEAYEIARFIYMKAKMNVKMDVPGSQAIVNDLKTVFKQSSSNISQN